MNFICFFWKLLFLPLLWLFIFSSLALHTPLIYYSYSSFHIQLSCRKNLTCIDLLSLIFILLSLIEFSIRCCCWVSTLSVNAECNDWVQWLKTITECNDWVQCLSAMTKCNDWMQWLSAMTECNDWVQWLSAITQRNNKTIMSSYHIFISCSYSKHRNKSSCIRSLHSVMTFSHDIQSWHSVMTLTHDTQSWAFSHEHSVMRLSQDTQSWRHSVEALSNDTQSWQV
jgi:hypothetical protein